MCVCEYVCACVCVSVCVSVSVCAYTVRNLQSITHTHTHTSHNDLAIGILACL